MHKATFALALLALLGCSERVLEPPMQRPTPTTADDLGAASDLAPTAAPDLEPKPQSQSCEGLGGTCTGDLWDEPCKSGFHKNAQPLSCGAGNCCVPDTTDCRTTGCPDGSYCAACLTPKGTDYGCLPNGSVC
jgi:hypothetical protein